jgi:hypothetical protein
MKALKVSRPLPKVAGGGGRKKTRNVQFNREEKEQLQHAL